MRWNCLILLAGLSPALWAQDYPHSPRGDVIDHYHGTAIADPYRWLEAVDAPDVGRWVQAQNALTRKQLKQLPGRESLRERLRTLWNYEKFGAPQQVGDVLFYTYNDGLRDQPVLMRQFADGRREVVLDLNALSTDGTKALTVWEVSPNGRYLAYGVAEAGSDWNRYFVRDLRSGQDEAEVLDYIKFSDLSWTHDSAGFYYSRYPAREGVFGDLENQALYYHRRGVPQSEDILIYARPDQPRWGISGEVSDSGQYLLISIWQGANEENALYARDLRHPLRPHVRGALIPVITDFKAKYTPIGIDASTLYLLTTDQAPTGRIVAVDLNRPQRRRAILEAGADTIEEARYAGGRLAVVRMHDAVHQLHLHDQAGVLQRQVTLPGQGSVTSMGLSADRSALLLSYSTFFTAGQQLRVDLASGSSVVLNQPAMPFDPADFVTEQVFYPSKDGTRIPLFINRRKDLPADAPRPTYLYGYGGFSISLTPRFRPDRIAWMERGGIYAVANLRGGGEYGEQWHRAGTRENKQNVFDDFIAAAEYLRAQGITGPGQLAIAGRSNGGLLVGAVSNQRPDLFAAAVAGVGVMDMLRFHQFTIGWAWTGDYGSADDAALFPVLRAYSPYHNVAPGPVFPAMLVTTADHDDRVVPGHSYKYIAALQHANPGSAPKLIRIETRAGHGRGTPTGKRIDQAADELAFMAAHTGLPLGATVPWARLLKH